jgi:hypothetical protein
MKIWQEFNIRYGNMTWKFTIQNNPNKNILVQLNVSKTKHIEKYNVSTLLLKTQQIQTIWTPSPSFV